LVIVTNAKALSPDAETHKITGGSAARPQSIVCKLSFSQLTSRSFIIEPTLGEPPLLLGIDGTFAYVIGTPAHLFDDVDGARLSER